MAPWQNTALTAREPKVSVQYIGNPDNRGHGPDELDTYGFTFVKRVPIDVPVSLANRLAKSKHFEVGDAIKKKPGRPKSTDAE